MPQVTNLWRGEKQRQAEEGETYCVYTLLLLYDVLPTQLCQWRVRKNSHILCQNSYASQKNPCGHSMLTKKRFTGWPLGAGGSCTSMHAEKLLLSTYSISKEKDPADTTKPLWIYLHSYTCNISPVFWAMVRKFNHGRRNSCGYFKPLWILL